MKDLRCLLNLFKIKALFNFYYQLFKRGLWIIHKSDLSQRKKNEKKKKRLRTRGNSSKYVLDKGIPIYPKPHKRLTTEFKVNFPGFCFPNKLFPGKTEYGRKD